MEGPFASPTHHSLRSDGRLSRAIREKRRRSGYRCNWVNQEQSVVVLSRDRQPLFESTSLLPLSRGVDTRTSGAAVGAGHKAHFTATAGHTHCGEHSVPFGKSCGTAERPRTTGRNNSSTAPCEAAIGGLDRKGGGTCRPQRATSSICSVIEQHVPRAAPNPDRPRNSGGGWCVTSPASAASSPGRP